MWPRPLKGSLSKKIYEEKKIARSFRLTSLHTSKQAINYLEKREIFFCYDAWWEKKEVFSIKKRGKLGLKEKRKGCINRERAGGTNGVDFRGQKEGSPKGVKSSKLIVYVICNLFEVRKWSVFFLEPCHREIFFLIYKNIIFNVFSF